MGLKFTLAHFGSSIFSQLRYAFSLHSSIHSGSFFLAEMKRIIPSFNPLGASSASISVTKPYLYSLRTVFSIVLRSSSTMLFSCFNTSVFIWQIYSYLYKKVQTDILKLTQMFSPIFTWHNNYLKGSN